MKVTLSVQAWTVIALPLLVECIFVTIIACLINQIDVERRREVHAEDLAYHLGIVVRAVLDRGTAALLHKLTYSADSSARFDHAADTFLAEREVVERLVQTNPHERHIWEALKKMSTSFDNIQLNRALVSEETPPAETAVLFNRAKQILNDYFALLDQLIDEQQTVQKQKKEIQARYRLVMEVTIVGAVAFNICLALALAGFFNKSAVQRLNILIDNTRRLASGQQLNAPIDGTDEIAELDRVFRELSLAVADTRERERAVLANAVDVICTVDSQGRLVQANQATQTLWGYQPDELIGTELTDLVLKEDLPSTIQTFERLSQEECDGTWENRVLRKDGEIAHMRWSMHWSAEEKKLFCVVHDTTARKEIEKLRSDFVAMVSHDLRTPMTSIQMSHELMARGSYGPLTEDGRKSLDYAESNAQQLINLVNNIIDIEKLTDGSYHLNRVAVPIDDILEPAFDQEAHFASQKDIGIEILKHHNIKVIADRDRMIQVVAIMLNNAVEFSPRGAEVTLSAEAAGDQLRVIVKDSGSGIPAPLQTAIFDRFLSRSQRQKHSGSGLSLAYAKALVENHKGEIGVESQAGNGSLFWFTLPKAQTVLTPLEMNG